MNKTPAIADVSWMIGPDGAARLQELAQSDQPLHTQLSRLRQELTAERASLLLEQVDLRSRAAAKFLQPEQMFFARVALEQATDQATARYKARRFTDCKSLVDLCCGIGGDLIALAGVAATTGVDSDPTIALLAETNLKAHRRDSSQVVVAQAGVDQVAQCDAWHADPDRRANGKRTTQVEFHSPDQPTLDAMLDACPNAGIKLAPATIVPNAWRHDAEREWISTRGECRQQVAWFGSLAKKPGMCVATRLSRNGDVVGQFHGRADQLPSIALKMGECLYEPDPSVLAAGLADDLAGSCGLKRVAPRIGYLTGPGGLGASLLAEFCVLEQLPLRAKAISGCLSKLGVGDLEIKTRGVKLDPRKLLKELKLTGDRSAVLLAYPVDGRNVAVIAERPALNA